MATTIWTAASQTGHAAKADYHSTGAHNWRNIILATYITANATRIRITIQAHSTNTTYVDHCAIGLRDTVNGEDYDGAPTEFLFGGNTYVSIAAGGSVTSDWLTYSINSSLDYLIHLWTDDGAGHDVDWSIWNPAGEDSGTDIDADYYESVTTDRTLTEDWTPDASQDYIMAVEKIEKEDAGSQTISAVGNIASSEGFGTLGANFRLFPGTIASEEAFGTLKANLKLFVDGIASGEAFGTSSISNWLQYLLPLAITSKEAFGMLSIEHIRRVVEEIFFDANIRRSESFIAFRNKLEEAIAHIKRIVDEE